MKAFSGHTATIQHPFMSVPQRITAIRPGNLETY